MYVRSIANLAIFLSVNLGIGLPHPYLRSVLSLVADCYEFRYFGLNGCYRLLNYDAGCLSAAELLPAFACLLYAKGGIPDVVAKTPVVSSFWSNLTVEV